MQIDEGANSTSAWQSVEIERLQTLLTAQNADLERARAILQEQNSYAAQIERLQQQLDNQRKEFEKLQQLTSHQSISQQQVLGSRQQATAPEINIENGQISSEFGTIIEALQINNLETKVPNFNDENNTIPLEFIEEVERFYRIKNISEQRKFVLLAHSLSEKARLWNSLHGLFCSFQEFKTKFIDEFYTVAIQVKIKSRWANQRCNEKKGSLQTYYFKQLKDANYLIPKPSNYEKNFTIIQQFPPWIRQHLASANFEDPSSIGQTLAHLD